MKTLTSTEFRREYAALEEPTAVTVLGRVIGTWYPGATGPRGYEFVRPAAQTEVPYNERPIHPVPKKGK